MNEERQAKLDLLRILVLRELEARYRGSALGNLWPIVNQLSLLLIYTYVFSIVLKVKLSITGIDVNENLTFGLWLFAGLIPWIAFSNGLSQASMSVINQPNLVKKVVFPLILLPLISVFSSFVESTAGIAILIFSMAIVSGQVHATLVLLPVVCLHQLLITAGLSYITAGMTVFLRDIPQTLGVVLNVWMYLTPIIYPASSIPEEWRPYIFWFNPLTPIVETYRDLILVGSIQHLGEWVSSFIISLIIFMIGFNFYKRLSTAFSDIL